MLFARLQSGVVFTATLFVSSAVADSPAHDSPVPVKGDTFMMGTPAEDIPELKDRFGVDFPGIFENETPAHEVTIDDYRIDRHQVTNSQFAEFVAANAPWRRGNLAAVHHNGHYLEHWQETGPPVDKGDHPVVFITWASAQAYCNWRGGRLPTEAEWEFAARAGDDREFPWGGRMPAPELVNYYADGIDATTPVGSYPPNDFGLYDMAGNVWEFLYDEWLPSYGNVSRTDPLLGGVVAGDRVLEIGGRRAVRGASFSGSEVNLRTRWRDSHVVTNAVAFVGFRCAHGF